MTSRSGTGPGSTGHLAEFKASVRWAVGNREWDPKSEKWKKPPRCPRTGKKLSVSRPEEWVSSYEEAERAQEERGYDFKGFRVVSPYHVTDVDDVIDEGEIDHRAVRIISEQDTYAERSLSGSGLHTIGIASKPEDQKMRFELDGLPVESYDRARFMIFTGDVIHERPIRDVQEFVDRIPMKTTKATSTEPVEVRPVEAEDEEIVEKALASKRDGERFRRLFKEGDLSEYGGDHSSADMALCNLLAFWTGRDPERIDRIFRSSALMREKWERADYRTWTISEAVENCRVVYEEVPEEVLNTLRALRMEIQWGKNFNACYVYRAHTEIAGRLGRPVMKGQRTKINGVEFTAPEDGIAYYASVRDLSLESGDVDVKTISSSNSVLREMGLLRLVSRGTMKRASVFLLPTSPVTGFSYKDIHGGFARGADLSTPVPTPNSSIPPHCGCVCRKTLYSLLWTSDLTPLQRFILEQIAYGRNTTPLLASHLGVKERTIRYTHIRILKERGLVEFTSEFTPEGTWRIRDFGDGDLSSAERNLAERQAQIKKDRENPENEYLEKKARKEITFEDDREIPWGARVWFEKAAPGVIVGRADDEARETP